MQVSEGNFLLYNLSMFFNMNFKQVNVRKEDQEGWFIPYMLNGFLNIDLGEVMVGEKWEEGECTIFTSFFFYINFSMFSSSF